MMQNRSTLSGCSFSITGMSGQVPKSTFGDRPPEWPTATNKDKDPYHSFAWGTPAFWQACHGLRSWLRENIQMSIRSLTDFHEPCALNVRIMTIVGASLKVIFFAISLFLGACFGVDIAWADADYPPEIALDFDRAEIDPAPLAAIGFLHGFSGHDPDDQSFKALMPAYIRSGRLDAAFVDRLQAFDIPYQLVLGDSWGYGGQGRKPHLMTAEWASHIRQTARAMVDKVSIWEPWNEPDHPFFWQDSEENWFQTWAIAARVLKLELGAAARIAGPSLAKFDADFLRRFSDFALEQGLEVNVLTWHALGGRISSLPEQVDKARRLIAENPRYAPLNIQAIHIDEIGNAASQYSPGTWLTWLRYAERSGADRIARACWPAASGEGPDQPSNCDAPNMAGLLDYAGQKWRATGFAHRWYVESRQGQRLRAPLTPKWLPVFVWQDRPGGTREAIIALADVSNGPDTIAVNLSEAVSEYQRLTDQGPKAIQGPTQENCAGPCATIDLVRGDAIRIKLP